MKAMMVIHTDTGMLKNRVVPILIKLWLLMATGRPSQISWAKPLTMVWVTSVAMKASSLMQLTIQALNSPQSTPQPRVKRTATGIGSPHCRNRATATPQKAHKDPGDRSFWPAIIRYVWPTATMPTRDAATRRLTKFVQVR